MITEDVTEVLTLIYSFSENDGLEKSIGIWQKISGRVCRGTESGKLDRGIKAELSGIKKA